MLLTDLYVLSAWSLDRENERQPRSHWHTHTHIHTCLGTKTCLYKDKDFRYCHLCGDIVPMM